MGRLPRIRRPGGPCRLACLIVGAAILAGGTPARAGTIGFTITNTVDVAAGITLKLEIVHTGDEAAYSVTPVVEFGDVKRTAERVPKMLPKARQVWTIPVQDTPPGDGSFVLLVRIRYEDANAYPFEVIATAPFDVHAARRRPVTGAFVIPVLDTRDQAQAKLALNAPAERAGQFDVRLSLPSGIAGSPSQETVDLSTKRSARIPLTIRNLNLLPGTTVNVFALITDKGGAAPQTDVVRGTVRIAAPRTAADVNTYTGLLYALAAYFIALQLIGGRRRPFLRPLGVADPWDGPAELALACGASAFLLLHYPWKDLLAQSITAGGDMASLYYPTKLLAEEIMPSGQLTGWTMGNYAGFPVLHFYSTLPFALIVLLSKVIPFLPMEVAFKLVTLSGPTLLPVAAAYLFRALGYGRGAAVLAAASVLPFVMQQGNSMWGGNIPSVLAGEFCHALGITLSLFYLGVLHRTVQGERRWPLAAALLAAIGLSHTFAFFATAWYTLFYLWPRPSVTRLAPPVIATGVVAALLLCFWGLPLPARLVFTSEWSMIWRIKDWKEVLPEPLWPAAWIAGANVLLMLVRIKSFRVDRQGLLLFVFAGAALLYFLVPALGFPDIRFIPIAQLFLGLIAADLIYWVGGFFRHRLAFAACMLVIGLGWAQNHLGYIPSWLTWNYAGYEGKTTWKLFAQINDHLRGDLNDPRVVFEHSQDHNRFGSSRAFENLPLFSGRSTLEGVFHQASPNSPFIFYLQSEASERGSGPFPQYTYTRLNPADALPHLRLFNVSDLVVVSDKARAAYEANPAFEKTFESGGYAIFHVPSGDTGYVVAAQNEPILYEGPNWKSAFYRWYKHHDLLDIPLVPREMISDAEARDFSLRTDSVTRLERHPYDGPCTITSKLEQYRISFDTTCPGRPHIVKVSYFPRWKAVDGSPILLVSPAFMLVYPKSSHFEMYYGRNFIDWLGLAISLGGLLLLVGSGMSPRLSDGLQRTLYRPFSPIFEFNARHYVVLSLVLLLLAVGGAWYTRTSLRRADRTYEAAQEAYRNRDFDDAIKKLEAWTAEDKDTFKQATALYQLGVSYSEVGNPAAAIEVHERLRFEFANVNYGAGTLFHLARNYEKLGMTDQARVYAQELERDFADQSWTQRLKRENPELFE